MTRDELIKAMRPMLYRRNSDGSYFYEIEESKFKSLLDAFMLVQQLGVMGLGDQIIVDRWKHQRDEQIRQVLEGKSNG